DGNGIIFFFAVHPSDYFRYGIVGNKLNRLGVRCGYKNDAKGQQGGFKHTGYGFTLYYERFFAVFIAARMGILIRNSKAGRSQNSILRSPDRNKKALTDQDLVTPQGIEPWAHRLRVCCSTS